MNWFTRSIFFVIITTSWSGFALSDGKAILKSVKKMNEYEIVQMKGGACKFTILGVEEVYIPKAQKDKLISLLRKARTWMAINQKEKMSFEKTVGTFKSTLYSNVELNGPMSDTRFGFFETKVHFRGSTNISCVSFFTSSYPISSFKTNAQKALLESNPCIRLRDGIHFQTQSEVDDFIGRLQGKAISEIDKKFR